MLCLSLKSSDFSDHSETAADYFSRSNRRGSIVSDLDDVSIPDVNSVSLLGILLLVYENWRAVHYHSSNVCWFSNTNSCAVCFVAKVT